MTRRYGMSTPTRHEFVQVWIHDNMGGGGYSSKYWTSIQEQIYGYSLSQSFKMSADSRTPEMLPLTGDHEHYYHVYQAVKGFSEESDALYNKWADDFFVPKCVEKLEASFPDLKGLNVLGIGSGYGKVYGLMSIFIQLQSWNIIILIIII